MRQFSPALMAEIDNSKKPQPAYLIEVTLDQPYALSTRQNLNWDNRSWMTGMIGEGSLRVDPESASFAIRNIDDQFTAAALNGAFQRQPVKVWWAYGLGEYRDLFVPGLFVPGLFRGPAIGQPVLMFSGIIASTPNIGAWLSIEATRETPRGYPRIRVRPPIANHLTPAGANIVFGGETYRVETR